MQHDVRGSHRLALFAAILAGACWGVSFLAPRALTDTSAVVIALLRFLFFGVSSALALAIRRKRRPAITPRILGSALALSLAGYSLYYSLLAYGVKGAGVTFATAIIGLLPLTILLAAAPAREWPRLALPILLIAVGGVLIPLELFGPAYAELLQRSPLERVLGLLATTAALLLWTGFAISNARFLRRNPEWHPLDWSGVLGIASAFTSALIFFVTERGHAGAALGDALGDPRVLAWTAFMGIAGAWIASALWNFASRVLASAALGMLLVFEAVFGLTFGFLYDGRWPGVREALAAACLVGGALVGMRILAGASPLTPSGRSSNVPSGAGE